MVQSPKIQGINPTRVPKELFGPVRGVHKGNPINTHLIDVITKGVCGISIIMGLGSV